MGAEQDPQSVSSLFGNRWLKLVAVAACLVVLGYFVYTLRRTLAPFLLGLVVAYIVNPLVEFAHARLRLPRALIVAVLVVALSVVLIGAAALAVSYVVRTVEQVVPQARAALCPEREPETFAERVRCALESIPNEIRVQIELAVEQLPATIRENFRSISASVFQGFGAVFVVLFGFVMASFKFVLFLVVTAYVLIDLPALGVRLKELLPARHRDSILRVMGDIDRTVRAFYRGQFLVSLALCAIYSVGLLLCRVDFAVLIGVAGGLADMVPYLGLVVGMLPALLFATVPFVGLVKPLGVVVVFAFGQTFAGMYLAPKIVGRKVGLHPVIVLLAIMVFGSMLGLVGVLFAVPLAAVLRVLLRELVSHYKRVEGKA